MAQMPDCDICNAERAVMMQSNLMDGSTVAVGGGCLLGFYQNAAAAIADAIAAAAHADGGNESAGLADAPGSGQAAELPTGQGAAEPAKPPAARTEPQGDSSGGAVPIARARRAARHTAAAGDAE